MTRACVVKQRAKQKRGKSGRKLISVLYFYNNKAYNSSVSPVTDRRQTLA